MMQNEIIVVIFSFMSALIGGFYGTVVGTYFVVKNISEDT